MYRPGGGWNKTHGQVGGHLCLDSFAVMKDWPEGRIGSIEWKRGSTVAGRLDAEQFVLAYGFKDGEQIQQAIDLSRIQNGYGGKPRTYFLCPFCGKRVQKLYFKDRRFRCRTCANLNYYSQQLAHNDEEAAWRMRRILQKDFGVTEDLAPIEMQYIVPDKPKWMRWKTYNRNVERLTHAQIAYRMAFIAGARAILGKDWE